MCVCLCVLYALKASTHQETTIHALIFAECIFRGLASGFMIYILFHLLKHVHVVCVLQYMCACMCV